MKTNKTKTNTTQRKRRRPNNPFKLRKTLRGYSKICIKASRRSRKLKMICRLIRLQKYPNQPPRIAGHWNSSTQIATSKQKPSLFLILCSARCKSKTNKSCLTLWSVRITFSFTLEVVKCGRCRLILGTKWRISVGCSSSSQILCRAIPSQLM